MNYPLRLLTENEIFRLTVWANPTNDPKRGTDVIGTAGAAVVDVWKTVSTYA
jgi:phosphatidylinositol 4-kinase